MEKGHHHHDPKEFSARMKACGVPDRVQEYMIRCTEFHTAPAPGVLIGAIMVDYALELLEANPEEKLFAVCETPKCLPDTLQVIAHSTTGNGRLTVLPIGKFAITVNRASDSSTAEGVRVWVDSEKLKNFPVIDMWYANSPQYQKHTMGTSLQEEIFRAKREILSTERVRVPVTGKLKWKPVICPSCGESVPDYLIVDGRCAACSSKKYYEKLL
ncbi:FmdE family protein [Methanoregula sp.]|uniref:FmdE family protein n=1 Tax=Methanoregula sp. TaxID=2052170 RepID=UPI0025E57F1F|nr:FmdE family protein [Methanoregula sp.]